MGESAKSAQNGILVIGAGLAGLTLALALAKRGIKCTVVEKQQAITPSRWAILLYPQGMKIFDELGVLSEITELAIPLKAPQVETVQGEVLAVLETGLLFEPRLNYSLALGPSEIRQILMRHATSMGVELVEGVEFLEVVRDAKDGYTVAGAKVARNGEEFEISCRLLVGADGYKSKVRSNFGSAVDSKDYSIIVGHFVEYETSHDQDRFRMILGDGYQVVILPCTKTKLSVGLTEGGLSEDDLVRKGGEDYVKKMIAEAAPFLSEAIAYGRASFVDGGMLPIAPRVVWVSSWLVEGGVLIGDAAHSFHPGAGQGAQQAFVDATTLSPIIESCLKANDFSRDRLAEFERLRRPLMRLLQSTSDRLISMETAKGRFNRWLRNRYFRAIGKLSGRKSFQEILAGIRAPNRRETLRVILALLL